ncbi:MAG: PAS domain S-box protein [Desulfuromonadaceae bacterium]|nr:PAS domain S-box protein [Desulfuromonadaceae bacterium]MDD5106667.1 PAS domain S-box protein [Desulfuromonadaceae bacterium]
MSTFPIIPHTQNVSANPLRTKIWLSVLAINLAVAGLIGFSLYYCNQDRTRWHSELITFTLFMAVFLLISTQSARLLTRELRRSRAAELALRQSQQNFRTLVENANDIIFVLSVEGIFTYVSPNWRDAFGYELAETIGKPFTPFVHPDDVATCFEALQQVSGSGEKLSDIVYRVQHKNGDWIWYSANASLLHDAESGEFSFLGIGRDITERKLAVEALIASETRFKQLLLDIPAIAVQGYAPDGTTRYWNHASERLYGYSAQEAIGQNLLDLIIPPEMRGDVEQAILFMAGSGQAVPASELSQMRKDGTHVPVFSSHAIVQSPGKEQELFCLDIDLTDLKRAEAALQKKEQYQRALLDNFPFAVWLKDTESRYLAVNKKFIDSYTPSSTGSIIGKNDFDFMPQELAETYQTKDREVMRTGRTIMYEEETAEHGVRTWTQTYKTPVISENGELFGTVGFTRDITAQKELEEERIKLEKLESLGVLAGGIAHDFNNILAGIMGSISYAQKFIEPEHRSYKSLCTAEKASARAAELSRQLLTFARGGVPAKTRVTVEQLINECVTTALRSSHVHGVITISPTLHAIEADEVQIRQAFTNIITNAVQAMPGGGIITVTACNEIIPEANPLSLPAGMYLNISFTDQGCGISEENLTKIFDPYFTTKSTGNGLGLASAYSIVTKHGGNLRVTSTPEAGTTFSVYLPAIEDSYSPPDTEPPILADKNHSGAAVLVMDDEEIIRDITTSMLEAYGYKVTSCADGTEAVERFKTAQKSGAPFSAVIMDLTVPGGMGGKEAARLIHAINPSACLIVSSGYSEDPVVANFRDFGFAGVLSKPYRMEDIDRLLGRLLSS